MVPDYDQIVEDDTGELEFYDSDGNFLGKFDSVADFNAYWESENASGNSEREGSGSTGADDGASGSDSEEDLGSDDAAGSTADSGTSSGNVAEGNENAGDTGGVSQDEMGNSVTVENWPTDYATSAQLETVVSDLVVVEDHLEVVSASMVVLVVLVAACVGVAAVRTLLKSFEGY